MKHEANPTLAIIRRKRVEARTGLPKSTMYDLIKAGTFPAPIPLGPMTVGWLDHEVTAWIEAQAAKRGCAK